MFSSSLYLSDLLSFHVWKQLPLQQILIGSLKRYYQEISNQLSILLWWTLCHNKFIEQRLYLTSTLSTPIITYQQFSIIIKSPWRWKYDQKSTLLELDSGFLNRLLWTLSINMGKLHSTYKTLKLLLHCYSVGRLKCGVSIEIVSTVKQPPLCTLTSR